MRRSPQKGILICLFVIALSLWNFSRLTGSECIRTIHIVTLLTAGAGIGVLIVNLFMLIRGKG